MKYRPFFKKTSDKMSEGVLSDVVPDYSATIAQIHSAFNSAGDRLYKEAVDIIANTKPHNEGKVWRLRNLGFYSSKEVKETLHVIEKRESKRKISLLIAGYKSRYPLYKFITEEEVIILCKKYSLICGPASKFTGFIPENKISAIESLKVSENDRNWQYDSYTYTRKNYITDLSIVAPQSQFDTTNMELKGFTLKFKPAPDPIVLSPVIGGFLIVCAWGEEASDPIVINEITN
jgi:hypothetical protein